VSGSQRYGADGEGVAPERSRFKARLHALEQQAESRIVFLYLLPSFSLPLREAVPTGGKSLLRGAKEKVSVLSNADKVGDVQTTRMICAWSSLKANGPNEI
jgi:hypothetical protein